MKTRGLLFFFNFKPIIEEGVNNLKWVDFLYRYLEERGSNNQGLIPLLKLTRPDFCVKKRRVFLVLNVHFCSLCS